MKKLLLFAFLLPALVSQAQHHLDLHLSQRLGAAPFALNTPVSAGSYEYKIGRLEYYVSEIEITHDGGQVTSIADLYLLVRPAEDSVYALGEFPAITTVEGIKFSVGVDAAHNHLDPATYPAGHPLAPQNPSMHWGWSAGYRFMAIEGVAGANFANVFEIHALGDANYKTVNLTTGAESHPGGLTIHLTADYTQALNAIDVSTGPIVHGTTGKAVTLLNNMANSVFTAASTATLDPAFAGAFAVSPNPAAAGEAAATMTLPAGFDYRLTLTDLTGRLVSAQSVAADRQSVVFDPALTPGLYFVQLWQNGRPVAVEKLVVVGQ